MDMTHVVSLRGEEARPLSQSVARALAEHRVCYLLGEQLREQLAFFDQRSWREFAGSWNNLCLDGAGQDRGKYRLRRAHAWEAASGGSAPRPPVRARAVEPLPFGVPGDDVPPSEPFEGHVVRNAFFTGLMEWALRVFTQLEGESHWKVEALQHRTVATPRAVAPALPPGARREGTTYLLMMLIKRTNVLGGETALYDKTGVELGRLTMLHPMDCVLTNDEQVLHGLTPILADRPGENACNDLMVARFTRQ